MINEKRVKKLIPYVEKILGRDVDLIECHYILTDNCNMLDSDNEVIIQLKDCVKRKELK